MNVKKMLTENSEDPDFSRLDGYDEMSKELQAKIRKAIEVGHVEDDEWKGVRSLVLMSKDCGSND